MYHRFFIVPEKFALLSGESTRVHCRLTDDFTQSDVAISPERINICRIKGNNIHAEIKNFYVEGKTLIFDIPKLEEGAYLIELILKTRIIDLTAEKFNSYLMHENLTQILNLIETQRLHKEIYREQYTHHAKTVIQVGSKRDATFFGKSLSHMLEIIPESDPLQLKECDILKVQVLYEENPLSFAPIAYGYSKYPYNTQSDENGMVKLKLFRSGAYFVHTIHMLPSQGDINWESFWATLTFRVL